MNLPKWKISFLSTLFPDHSLERLCAMARAYEIEGLELRLEAGHAHGLELDIDVSALSDLVSTFDEFAIGFASLGSRVRLGTGNAELVRRLVDFVPLVGAKLVRIFIDNQREDETVNEWRERVRKDWATVSDIARRRSCLFAIENHGDTGTVAEIVKFDLNDARVVWDIAHTIAGGEAPNFSLRLLGDRLVHVHVKDWLKDGQNGWQKGAPLFDGDFDVTGILNRLTVIGYSGFISLEVRRRLF